MYKTQTITGWANVFPISVLFGVQDGCLVSKLHFFPISNPTTAAGLDTPVDLKLKLIPMLQHMHHDASLASSSRDLLQHLVNSYPSTPMVIVSLHTFTQLAAFSLIDIPKQVCPQRKRRYSDTLCLIEVLWNNKVCCAFYLFSCSFSFSTWETIRGKLLRDLR